MKTKELIEKTGLTAHTLRFYEKKGLIDSRYIIREKNNYRNYSDDVIECLNLIKKFQGVGCSLDEIKVILQNRESNTRTNEQVVDWICEKISDIKRKKQEYDEILDTLNMMLEYRMTLKNEK